MLPGRAVADQNIPKEGPSKRRSSTALRSDDNFVLQYVHETRAGRVLRGGSQLISTERSVVEGIFSQVLTLPA